MSACCREVQSRVAEMICFVWVAPAQRNSCISLNWW
jgi:hypothetical protein